MTSPYAYEHEVKILKTLAQSSRLQILKTLKLGPKCVCELSALLHQRQPYISQQLMVLKDAGLVSYVSDGAKKYYHLNPTKINETCHALSLLVQG
jgi:ArsR family transcriptional regulator